MNRVVVVGATKNFFKVGHATFHELARTRPDVRMRLGILDVVDARRAVAGLDVELVAWSPETPGSLDTVMAGCDAMLMVPPIDGRVRVSRAYIDTAQHAGIRYILCLGVQFPPERCTMAGEAAEVDRMLAESGIPYDLLYLPMFLENLLYQVPSITRRRQFRFPVDPGTPFSYLTCGDLGEAFAKILVAPPSGGLGHPVWTGSDQLTCREWSELLSEAVGAPIVFAPQPGDEFVKGLVERGMSPHAGRAILGLWTEIERGGDVTPNPAFAAVLGHDPTSAAAWTKEHGCCFDASGGACRHPKPPREHMF